MKVKFSVVFAALLLVVSSAVAESDYPVKPVRLIVPFPPGGVSDVVGRLLAEKWSAAWGQPVVIDNVPGAAGTIGLAKLAKSPPDG
ncbi:MAG: ABC transporter substrate-binding protein, partial [Alphaproteobacteria bacterium]